MFALTQLFHLLCCLFLALLSQFPYLPSGSEYFWACTIDYEQETHTCTGCSPLWPWNITRWPRKKEKKIQATNEVLSEINNAMCTVLKDFSNGGVFFYGPLRKVVKWVVGGVARGCKVSSAGVTVQTTAARQASYPLYRPNIWKICVQADTQLYTTVKFLNL